MKLPKKPFYSKPNEIALKGYLNTLSKTPAADNLTDFTNKQGYTVTAKDLEAWKKEGMDWGSTKALADWYDTLPAQPNKDIRYGFGTPTQRNDPNRQMSMEEWDYVKKTMGINDTNNRTRLSLDDLKSQGRDVNNPIEPYNNFINENISQVDELLRNYRGSKKTDVKLPPNFLAKIGNWRKS